MINCTMTISPVRSPRVSGLCNNGIPMISKEYVERVSVEAHRYSDEQMAGELHQFFEEQTAMCEFIAEVTTESSPEVQELSFSLSYVIFKAAKLGSNGALAAVPADRVEAAYHEAES